jgi:hypothetical protein
MFTVMWPNRHQLAMADPGTGTAAGQTETIGGMIDDRPFIQGKIKVRPDGQFLRRVGLVTESE